MNQENKFGEYWKKILQYWAVFTAACGRFYEKAKEYAGTCWAFLSRNGKIALQKLAAWLLRARQWLLKVTASARRWCGTALEHLSAWVLGVWEKMRPAMLKLRDRCAGMLERFKTRKENDSLPPVQETAEVEKLPVVAAVAEESVQAEPEQPARKTIHVDNPYLQKALTILAAVGRVLKIILKWIWRLRSVFMAIPVVWAAVKLAMQNMERLPERVGLDIQSTGEFARMITREEAVYWPLGITMFCLLLMLCSKKPILPWVISIFTLVLPWLIWILNYYA